MYFSLFVISLASFIILHAKNSALQLRSFALDGVRDDRDFVGRIEMLDEVHITKTHTHTGRQRIFLHFLRIFSTYFMFYCVSSFRQRKSVRSAHSIVCLRQLKLWRNAKKRRREILSAKHFTFLLVLCRNLRVFSTSSFFAVSQDALIRDASLKGKVFLPRDRTFSHSLNASTHHIHTVSALHR